MVETPAKAHSKLDMDPLLFGRSSGTPCRSLEVRTRISMKFDVFEVNTRVEVGSEGGSGIYCSSVRMHSDA